MARRGLLNIVLVSSLLSGCSGDDPSPTDPPGGGGEGEISGVVARHKTGEGVPGVVVAALLGDQVVATTHTDADGAFALEGMGSGAVTVRVTGTELAGLDVRYDAVDPVQYEGVAPGGADPLVFAVVGLIPSRITGDVVCQGTPVPGARIRVIGGRTDETVVTNATGRYGALDLYPGAYAVIPVEVPCAVTPAFGTATLVQGEFAEVDFEGGTP